MRSNLRDRARQTDTDDDQTDGRHYYVRQLTTLVLSIIVSIFVMGVSIGAGNRVRLDRSVSKVLESWDSEVTNATGANHVFLRAVDPVMDLALWSGWKLAGVSPIWTMNLLLTGLTVGVLILWALSIPPLAGIINGAFKRVRGDTT